MVERLKADMIQAMKEKDKERLTVIRMVKAAMDLEHIDRKREINDELLIDVVSKQVKMREESILEFEKGNREDSIETTTKEIEILKAYLPEQLSESEVVEEIEKIFAEVKPESVKDMGKVMKEATAKLRGRADMKKVSEIIKSKLQ